MDDTSAAYQLYVGVDVAADTFTASWLASGKASTAVLATCAIRSLALALVVQDCYESTPDAASSQHSQTAERAGG